jgi:hypothetical protein
MYTCVYIKMLDQPDTLCGVERSDGSEMGMCVGVAHYCFCVCSLVVHFMFTDNIVSQMIVAINSKLGGTCS